MTRVPITMPTLGSGIDEGKIVKWVKQLRDTVERGDVVLEVESEKALIEVEALDSGTLVEILHGKGAKIAVGETIGYLDSPGE